jgi:metallophosphoesterase superfamily enzyme
VPALPPGTVKGGDSGGVSLRCFGGVETMKIFVFPSFNRFANCTQNMTYNIQSHQHHYKLLRYVYFYQISTVKTLAVMLF